MAFTYKWYRSFISLAQSNYVIKDWKDSCDGIILRHDVDYDLRKAYEFAVFEQKIGVKSTYFLLLSGDFYNVFSLENQKYIREILSFGHSIGLHFDETRYSEETEKTFFIDKIKWEADILTDVTGSEIKAVSMHRPSERMLNWDIEIPGLVNTYSKQFFRDYKYLSDSRRMWREDAVEILNGRQYRNIQVLIHPFWYMEEELDIHDTISSFINSANLERFESLNKNITNLDEIMKKSEVK